MCGLIGFVTNQLNGFTTQDNDVFKQLLYLDALRGQDSTGIAVLYNDGEMEIAKEAVPAQSFLEGKEPLGMFYSLFSRGKAAIGHNRKKTIGEIKDATAHPFVIDNENQKPQYAFIHNGTLLNFPALIKDLPTILNEIGVSAYTIPSSDVDSEVLGTLLTRCDGDITKISTVLSHVHGAYACAWIDQKTETLYLVRNSERPLFIAKTENGLLFASEINMLVDIALRNNVKILEWEEVKAEQLWSIDLNIKDISILKEELSIPKKASPTNLYKIGGFHMGTTTESTIGSKNYSKRFVKKYLGTRISFWIHEIKPTSFSHKQKHFFVGEALDLDVDHIIRGFYDLPQGATYKNVVGNLFYATISAVDFDKTDKQLIISVKDITENVYSKEYC